MTKILVIEDEQVIREEVVDVLELEGYEAVGAENGLVGIEMARQSTPDLILCDIIMPEMDGYAVLIDLRNNDATAHIPFLFMTAKADRSDWRKGMELGADDYLTKPFTQEELLHAIQSRLDKSKRVTQHFERKMEDFRGAIVHMLPHELRTPLTSIMGYAAILREDPDGFDLEQRRSMIEGIYRGGSRLMRLIENYLTLAQIELVGLAPETIEKRKQIQVRNPTHVASAVEKVAHERAETYDREADVVLEVEDTPVPVWEEDLRKIVDELVDNACKFSASETPIEIGGYQEDGVYVLRVKDCGRGMSREQVNQIGAFVQFERKIHEQQGAGLGLTIAQRLVQLQGGVLTIESEPEVGTTVFVEFASTDRRL